MNSFFKSLLFYYLFVSLSLDHNQFIQTLIFLWTVGYYPEDRQPTTEEKADIERLLKLGVPRGKIALNLHEESGKILKKSDLDNMAHV